ncbi:MAG: NAD(P)H:quinone oxidoreductase [Gammaproteobacteria bacterium]|jgi:NAD(P)H dehydrogenase (quinone)|nr:NAD(P)H:quinone oxidoreductase [Gammaproteobacteria bacterium]MCH1551396.1 NAD(P)H:quinone oxidoreductase [Pseudomonadales bacterium]
MTEPYILILYFSQSGSTKDLALHMARGVDRVAGINAKLRTVAPVDSVTDQVLPKVPAEGAVYCTKSELSNCAGLLLGSATRFGNMAAPLKHFLDNTADLWMNRALVNKPAGVFTSSHSLHGGQETTLMSMMVPLLHHGMIIKGLSYAEDALNQTRTGGTPYGASHVAATGAQLSEHEAQLALIQGEQLAKLALKLL